MQITAIAALISITVTAVSCLIAVVVKFGKIINGQKCLLRSEMLKPTTTTKTTNASDSMKLRTLKSCTMLTRRLKEIPL